MFPIVGKVNIKRTHDATILFLFKPISVQSINQSINQFFSHLQYSWCYKPASKFKKISALLPHSLSMVSYDSQNEQPLFSQASLTTWSLWQGRDVICRSLSPRLCKHHDLIFADIA
jgi:hypothetical protein